jgi:trans-aconitate methyltransferase
MGFAAIATAYELLADASRLERELPFLRAWTAGHRVLDLACGSGEHLAALAPSIAAGCGVDLEPAMVARAVERHPTLSFLAGDLRSAPLRGWDRVLLLGNAANCLADPAELADLIARLDPGARMLVQVTNPARAGADHSVVVRRRADAIAVKTAVRAGDHTLLTVTLHQRTVSGWTSATDHQTLLRLDDTDLRSAAAGCGFAHLRGGLDGSPYEPETSPDLVLDVER